MVSEGKLPKVTLPYLKTKQRTAIWGQEYCWVKTLAAPAWWPDNYNLYDLYTKAGVLVCLWNHSTPVGSWETEAGAWPRSLECAMQQQQLQLQQQQQNQRPTRLNKVEGKNSAGAL